MRISVASLLILLLPAAASAQEAFWVRYHDSGWNAYRDGKYAEAKPLFEKAIAQAKDFGQSDPRLALSQAHLALVLEQMGKRSEAETAFQTAAGILEKPDTSDKFYLPRGFNALGLYKQKQKRYGDAETYFRRAKELQEKALGPKHPIVGQIVSNLATVCAAQGKYAEAEPLFRQAAEARRAAPGDNSRLDLARTLSAWGTAYCKQRKYKEAEPLFREALQIRRGAKGLNPLELALSLGNLATVYYEQGTYAPAQALLQEALKLRRKALPAHDARLAPTYRGLALTAKGQGNLPEALKYAAEERECLQMGPNKNNPELAACHELIASLERKHAEAAANAVEKARNYQSASESLRAALKIRQFAQGDDYPATVATRYALANLLRDEAEVLRKPPERTARQTEARTLYDEVVRSRQKRYGPEHLEVAKVLDNYVRLLQAMKDKTAPDKKRQADQIRAKQAGKK